MKLTRLAILPVIALSLVLSIPAGAASAGSDRAAVLGSRSDPAESPATRSVLSGRYLIRSNATSLYLVADWNEVYTYDWAPEQTWSLQNVYSYWYLFQGAIGQCLRNNGSAGVNTAPCSGSDVAQLWTVGSDGHIQNYYGDYLSTDYSRDVYMAGYVANQTWNFQSR